MRDGDREQGMLGVGEHGRLASGRWKGHDAAAGEPLQKTKPGDVWHRQSGC